MTITRLHNGAYQISAIVRGYLVTKTYYGYTKREAARMFRQDTREGRHDMSEHTPTPAERTADLLYDDVRRLMAENARLREVLLDSMTALQYHQHQQELDYGAADYQTVTRPLAAARAALGA